MASVLFVLIQMQFRRVQMTKQYILTALITISMGAFPFAAIAATWYARSPKPWCV